MPESVRADLLPALERHRQWYSSDTILNFTAGSASERFTEWLKCSAATLHLLSDPISERALPPGLTLYELKLRTLVVAFARYEKNGEIAEALDSTAGNIWARGKVLFEALGISSRDALPKLAELDPELRHALQTAPIIKLDDCARILGETYAQQPRVAVNAVPSDIANVIVPPELYRSWFQIGKILEIKANSREWFIEALQRSVATLYILSLPEHARRLPQGINALEVKMRSFLLAYVTHTSNEALAETLGCHLAHLGKKGTEIKQAMGIASRHYLPNIRELSPELRRAIADTKVIPLKECANRLHGTYRAQGMPILLRIRARAPKKSRETDLKVAPVLKARSAKRLDLEPKSPAVPHEARAQKKDARASVPAARLKSPQPTPHVTVTETLRPRAAERKTEPASRTAKVSSAITIEAPPPPPAQKATPVPTLGKPATQDELCGWCRIEPLEQSKGDTAEERCAAAAKNAVSTMILVDRTALPFEPVFERRDYLQRMLLGTVIGVGSVEGAAMKFGFRAQFIETHLLDIAKKLGCQSTQELLTYGKTPDLVATIPFLSYQDMDSWRLAIGQRN